MTCKAPTTQLTSSNSTSLGDFVYTTPAYYNVLGDDPAKITSAQDLQNEVFDVDTTLELKSTIIKNVIENPNILPINYPVLFTVVGESPERNITVEDLTEFLISYSYTEDTLLAEVTNDSYSTAENLNTFYSGSDSISYSVTSLCSYLSLPFGLVTLAETLMNLTLELVDVISDLKTKLISFVESIKTAIDNLIKGLKNIIMNIEKSISKKVSSLEAIGSTPAINQHFTNKLADARDSLGPKTVEGLKTNLDNFVATSLKNYAVVTEEVIEHLLYIFCGMTGDIEEQLRKKMKPLEDISSKIDLAYNDLKLLSDTTTQRAVENGRPDITAESKKAQSSMWISDANASYGQSSLMKRISYTPEKTSLPDPKSWSNLAFAPSVINNSFWNSTTPVDMIAYIKIGRWPGSNRYVIPANLGEPVDVGYWRAKLELYDKANQIAKRMGTKFTINSAYRHVVYNANLKNSGRGAALNSQHTYGNALDISTSGFSTGKINEMADLFRAYGFGGFGKYSTFVHFDLRGQTESGNFKYVWNG